MQIQNTPSPKKTGFAFPFSLVRGHCCSPSLSHCPVLQHEVETPHPGNQVFKAIHHLPWLNPLLLQTLLSRSHFYCILQCRNLRWPYLCCYPPLEILFSQGTGLKILPRIGRFRLTIIMSCLISKIFPSHRVCALLYIPKQKYSISTLFLKASGFRHRIVSHARCKENK